MFMPHVMCVSFVSTAISSLVTTSTENRGKTAVPTESGRRAHDTSSADVKDGQFGPNTVALICCLQRSLHQPLCCVRRGGSERASRATAASIQRKKNVSLALVFQTYDARRTALRNDTNISSSTAMSFPKAPCFEVRNRMRR
jgi:hypothetical protein